MSERYPINEVFETIQGEARFTGAPAVFVRLQGCPVGCAFCDTKHTWAQDPRHEVHFDEIVDKFDEGPSWAWASVDQIIDYLDETSSSHVVFTGGEPAMFDLTRLTDEIIASGRTVQIETSGTFEIRVSDEAWVTLSPKIGMAGGLKVRRDAVQRADEIKMPVGKSADIQKLKEFLDLMDLEVEPLVWLQPLSQQEKATALCIEAARENGWRLSAQLHKYLKVR